MSSLPPFVALRARFNSMERFVANVTEGSRKDCLELSTEAELIINVKAKFAVEPSTDGLDATSNNRDTLFEVVKLGENLIALRNRGNSQFCKSLTTEGKRNCLNAGTTSVEPDARLIVGEPMVSRSIEVNFRLMDARIYHQKPLTVASVTVPNNTHLQHEIVTGLSYTQTQISTWNNTLSLTVGGSVAIKTGIPIISEGKFEVYGSVTESIEFGKSKDFSKQVSPEYRVPVPPMTKVIVKVIATEAKYDIPFSYIQTDLYPTGERVVQELDDGIYKGVESYDFHFVTEYEKL
ncbi:Natterin-2 [Bienertia sinuspersici]